MDWNKCIPYAQNDNEKYSCESNRYYSTDKHTLISKNIANNVQNFCENM